MLVASLWLTLPEAQGAAGRSARRGRLRATRAALMAALRSAVGRHVRVTGHGFAAQTGHHHAPLVVLADRVTVD